MLSGHAHLLAAAPRDRAHIAVDEIVCSDRIAAGLIDFGDRIRDIEIHDFAAGDEALGMLGQFEDFAAVSAFAFEDGACVMQRMRQQMDLRVPPRHELAIKPDKAVAIVIGNQVCHSKLP